jgi:DNA (cytosine-5)-methyltransferase 1
MESGYLFDVREVKHAASLTAHRARPHSERDLRDFERLEEGESSAEAMRRGVEFEFPYDKSSFKDRYTRQHRKRPCSTIVAHLAKDGLMFIHPTQNRSLTPREAARIQSFPDWFHFPIARTHQFRVIGNAVPPLVGEAVGLAVKAYLANSIQMTKIIDFDLKPLPKDEAEAVTWLLPLLDLDARALRKIPNADFKRAWFAIGFIYMGLHPDSALDHGTKVVSAATAYSALSRIEPRLSNPYYEQSGWPVILAPIANEARRRSRSGLLDDNEYYCCEAQMAGACFRNPVLIDEVRRGRKVNAS